MATTLIGGMATAAPVYAQDGEETITVTGSRIVRQDFVANSPVATVSAEQVELTGTINTEGLLNTLPQTVPGLDRTSNNPGNGTATVDLRGLGSGRTLVLIDGTRAMPGGTGGTVDLNTIPSSMIERVEVVTGGASAVYGSDAIAGVVNFIMKDDFEGVQINTGYEISEENDAEYTSVDVTIGGNFDNGRGNVVMNVGYINRGEVFQGDRAFSNTALGGTQQDAELVPLGSSGVPEGHLFGFANVFDWSGAGLAPVISGSLSDFNAGCGAEGLFTQDPDGSVTDPLVNDVSGDEFCRGDILFDSNGQPTPWINSGPNNTRYNYAPINYLQLPQERYNAFIQASYDITDSVTLTSRATFSHNAVDSQLAPTPAFSFFTVNLDNPFLGSDTVALLTPSDTDSDGLVDFYLGRRMEEVGPRRSNDTRTVFQFQVGLQGELENNWVWDAYFQSGRSFESTALEGDISAIRLQQALLTTDGVNCTDTSNGCVPINVFGAGNISAGAAAFVSTRINSELERNQIVGGISLAGDTGGAFELPGGPISFAVGTEYRSEDADFRPSQDLAAGTLLGFNGAPPVGGGYDVYDVYGEALLPILNDRPGFEILELELAARYSDYSTAGGTDAFKVGGRWAPTEEVAFRASWNTATRAPNVGELFSPASNGFPGASDPCAAPPLGAYAADARLDALCAATGVPAADVGTDFQPNGQIETILGGNANLDAEEAETFTIGAIFEPAFLEGFSASIDYFDIEITGGIGAPSAQFILDSCYSVGTQAGEGNTDPNTDACQRINRFAGGAAIDTIVASLGNIAVSNRSGYDIQFAYDIGELESLPGSWNINFLGTYLEESSSQQTAGAAVVDCVGVFSGSCGEPTQEWNHRATLGWLNGSFSTQLLWRYIGESTSQDGADQIDGESYFDISTAWEINDTFSLTGGIDNLLDTEPPILGDNQEQANTWPATYDVFGRTYWVNLRTRF
jgi:outer membrane receptor protein involved in Fe transport